jgi:hypothetical protein
MDTFADLQRLLACMSEEQKAELDKTIAQELSQKWLPQPGPQTDAYFSEADLLLYGGAAGGGKTDLLCGLSLTQHHRTVIFRRQSNDLDGFWDRLMELSPDNERADSVKKRVITHDGRLIECGHLENPGSERSWQGRPHDLIGFDEGAQLTAYKVNFVLGWLRSAAGHRCRAVIASNPPLGGDGQWLVEWFAPWLDPAFIDRAEYGELRWAVTVGDQNEIRTVWVDGPGKHVVDGVEYEALSRTFIPSKLEDNLYLKDTNYRAQINAMPEPLRSQLLHGDFMAGREDDPYQIIPTEWVLLAQERWRNNADKPKTPMLHMGVDVAQGGADTTTIALLYGNRIERIVREKGKNTPDGPSVAQMILAHRRNDCGITIDLTGGWGGSARDHLRTHHDIKSEGFVASAGSQSRTKDGKLGYLNLRAESWWKMREELDPSGETLIELPPDERLKAQLTAPRWKLRGDKIIVESKDDLRARLGSSTDEADAVIMAWFNRGLTVARRALKAKKKQPTIADPLGAYRTRR